MTYLLFAGGDYDRTSGVNDICDFVGIFDTIDLCHTRMRSQPCHDNGYGNFEWYQIIRQKDMIPIQEGKCYWDTVWAKNGKTCAYENVKIQSDLQW